MMDVLETAISSIRRHGLSVEAADIPGLYNVTGMPELTTNQLINFAMTRDPMAFARPSDGAGPVSSVEGWR